MNGAEFLELFGDIPATEALDRQRDEINEMRQVLQWASENVVSVQVNHHINGWDSFVLKQHLVYHAPTLYQALKTAWEARDK